MLEPKRKASRDSNRHKCKVTNDMCQDIEETDVSRKDFDEDFQFSHCKISNNCTAKNTKQSENGNI